MTFNEQWKKVIGGIIMKHKDILPAIEDMAGMYVER